MESTLQTLFLLKQHVLPVLRSSLDIGSVAIAAPVIAAPCDDLCQYLSGIMTNVATQFREKNLEISYVFAQLETWFSAKYCRYTYKPWAGLEILRIRTPVISWRCETLSPCYVVPTQDSPANLEFIRPVMDAVCRILGELAAPEYKMRVLISRALLSHGLPTIPEAFHADMIVYVIPSVTPNGKYTPYIRAGTIRMRDPETSALIHTLDV